MTAHQSWVTSGQPIRGVALNKDVADSREGLGAIEGEEKAGPHSSLCHRNPNYGGTLGTSRCDRQWWALTGQWRRQWWWASSRPPTVDALQMVKDCCHSCPMSLTPPRAGDLSLLLLSLIRRLEMHLLLVHWKQGEPSTTWNRQKARQLNVTAWHLGTIWFA